MFDDELSFFIENQADLVSRFNGKTLLLRGRKLVAAFDTPLEAYLDALKRFKPGTFMLQPCRPGPDAYTATISPCLPA